MVSLLTNKAFQVFVFAILAMGLIGGLVWAGKVSWTDAQVTLGLIIGFGLGVPVNTEGVKV